MGDYDSDGGFDSTYEPALPEHDLVGQARAEGLELYQIGTGDLLVYDAASKKRVLSVAPTGVLDLEEALEEQTTVKGVEGTFRIGPEGCSLETPDGQIDGGTKLCDALGETLNVS